MGCSRLLRDYAAEQPGALVAYILLAGASTACQALVLPTCANQAKSSRVLVLLSLCLVVVAGLETLASEVYCFLAPNLERRLGETMLKRCLHTWNIGVRDEGQFVCGFSAAVNATATIGNFAARFALRSLLSAVVLLGVVATVSPLSAGGLALCLGGVGALSAHLFDRVAQYAGKELQVRDGHAKFLSETVANFTHVVVNGGSEERCDQYSSVCRFQEEAYRRTCARMRDYCAAVMFGGAVAVALSVGISLWDLRRRRQPPTRFLVVVGAGVYYFQVTVTFGQQLAALGYNVGQLQGWSARQDAGASPLDRSECAESPLTDGAELVVEGVRASRGSLAALSLVLTTKDRFCLFARSGSGKSSLLLALAGLEPLAEGRVLRKGRCTFIPQEATVWEGTLWSNLKFGNELLTRERAQSLLEPTGLLEVFPSGLDSPVDYRGQTWSAGQRKLAVVLRALLREQDLGPILADEPLASLDTATARCVAVFFEQRTRGRAVLCITHTNELPFEQLHLRVLE